VSSGVRSAGAAPKDVLQHVKQCPNMVVSCSFAAEGCDQRGTRQKIVGHEEQKAVAHSRLAARRVGHERERNVALEQELQRSRAEVSSSKNLFLR